MISNYRYTVSLFRYGDSIKENVLRPSFQSVRVGNNRSAWFSKNLWSWYSDCSKHTTLVSNVLRKWFFICVQKRTLRIAQKRPVSYKTLHFYEQTNQNLIILKIYFTSFHSSIFIFKTTPCIYEEGIFIIHPQITYGLFSRVYTIYKHWTTRGLKCKLRLTYPTGKCEVLILVISFESYFRF